MERLKNKKEIGVKYMNLQEVIEYRIEEAVEAAVEENTKETEMRMSRLTKMLLEAGRIDDLMRTAEEPEFLAKMLEEYNL